MKPNNPQGKPTKNRAFKRHLNTFLTAVAKPTVVPRSCPIPSAMISNPDLSRGMLLPHIHSRNLYLDIYIYYTRYIDIYIYICLKTTLPILGYQSNNVKHFASSISAQTRRLLAYQDSPDILRILSRRTQFSQQGQECFIFEDLKTKLQLNFDLTVF